MNADVYIALIAAISPMAVAWVGFWIKRSGDARTASILVIAEANKIIAENAAEVALLNLQKSKDIESKVDGRLTKAVDDLAASRVEVKDLHTAFSVFQARVDSFLQTGVGRGELREAAGAPMPAVATPITGNPAEQK